MSDSSEYESDGSGNQSVEEYTYHLASCAPLEIKNLVISQNWSSKMGELAIAAIQKQLTAYQTAETDAKARTQRVSSLFDNAAAKIGDLLGYDPEADLEVIRALPEPVAKRMIWKWEKLPYTTLCAGRSSEEKVQPQAKKAKISEGSALASDIDEWVLKNERWLRDSRQTDKWETGLVRLWTHAGVVFPGSTVTETARQITRKPQSGFCFLDQKRAPTVMIQPSRDSFIRKFDEMTGGQLKGVDWNNLFIAGGIVLGTLFSVDGAAVDKANQWKASDIDIYIYGLNPPDANKKIRHLFSIFKQNLPEGSPTLVVRNSKTVTFLSQYPLRRFQIILKKVRDPKEVLLNFDLDICAVGFDGTDVWMLPRAAHSIETGYNVFTMDVVEGHYLGDRRASQEQRVFKYANRGFGIRILPSYVDSVGQSVLDEKVKNARHYFDRVFETYMSWSNGGTQLETTYSDQGYRPQSWRVTKPDITLPVFTHTLFDTRDQYSPEPGSRSCLTGFELLFRHVALWEAEQAEKLIIQDDVWASTTYDDGVVSYDDLPRYPWDETFSIGAFKAEIDRFNLQELEALHKNLDAKGYDTTTDILVSNVTPKRMLYGDNIDDVLNPKSRIVIPLYLPNQFIDYANAMVAEGLIGLPLEQPLSIATKPEFTETQRKGKFVYWTVSENTAWQQVDRRIDEVTEILWSFHRANGRLISSSSDRLKSLLTQISRRSIRKNVADELSSFKQWVERDPGGIAGTNYGAMGQGFWDEAFPDLEDDDE